MPSEKFWEAFGSILGGMPPALAGVVLIALALAVLAYSWRRATDEAKKEREKAATSTAALSDQKLDAILSTVTATADRVADIHTVVEVLKDRRGR